MMEAYLSHIPEKKKGFFLDPRTKFLFMILIATLMFVMYSSVLFVCVLAALPLLFLLLNKQMKIAVIYGILFALAVVAHQYKDVVELPGVINAVSVLLIALVMRMFPTFMMGYYIIKSTTADEFVAAMERWHVTKKVLIPIAVVFRFVPTMQEEAHSISEAMRMREIRFGSKKFWREPGLFLEYRLIPLLMSIVKIGDELSASALTRGLGRPGKRSSIAEVGFTKYDYALLIASISLIIWALYGW